MFLEYLEERTLFFFIFLAHILARKNGIVELELQTSRAESNFSLIDPNLDLILLNSNSSSTQTWIEIKKILKIKYFIFKKMNKIIVFLNK